MSQRKRSETAQDSTTDSDRQTTARTTDTERATGTLTRLHQHAGNRSVQRMADSSTVGDPPARGISDPGDASERAAKRAARSVMGMRGSVVGSGQDADGPHQKADPSDTAPVSETAPHPMASVTDSGEPLDPSARSFFERRFGTDFGDVRVHTGTGADRAARAVSAEAFTYGTDLVFRRGRYDPDRSRGKSLLAHELAHVIQQDAAGTRYLQRNATSATRQPRSLTRSLDPAELSDRELRTEIRAIRRWLDERARSSPRIRRLRETLSRLEAEQRRRDSEQVDTDSSDTEEPETKTSSTAGGMTSAEAPASVPAPEPSQEQKAEPDTTGGMTSASAPASTPAQESEPKMSVPKDSATAEAGEPRAAGRRINRGESALTGRELSGRNQWWNCIKGAAVGAGTGVWGFIKAIGGSILNPITTIKKAYNGIYDLVQQIVSLQLGAAAKGAFPRIYKLVMRWVSLASYNRCRLIGEILAEYGADILSGAGAAKIIKKLKRLKRTSGGTADIDSPSSGSSPDTGRTRSAEQEQRRSSETETASTSTSVDLPAGLDPDTPVLVNKQSNIYHPKGTQWFEKGLKDGTKMTARRAEQRGYRPTKAGSRKGGRNWPDDVPEKPSFDEINDRFSPTPGKHLTVRRRQLRGEAKKTQRKILEQAGTEKLPATEAGNRYEDLLVSEIRRKSSPEYRKLSPEDRRLSPEDRKLLKKKLRETEYGEGRRMDYGQYLEMTISGRNADLPTSKYNQLWIDLMRNRKAKLRVPKLSDVAKKKLSKLAAAAEARVKKSVHIEVVETAPNYEPK